MIDGKTCAICGVEPAKTIEHYPPIEMFRGRDRPKGLEFPACERCNHGSSHADMVAALIGRMYGVDEGHPDNAADIKRLINTVRNNCPDAIKDIDVRMSSQRRALKGLSPHFIQEHSVHGGILGPSVDWYLNLFSAKLAFALRYHETGTPMPAKGALFATWRSNHQRLMGDYPSQVANAMPSPKTLAQGKKQAWSQFEYSCRTDMEGGIGIIMASFRLSFAVFATWVDDRTTVDWADNSNPYTHTPESFCALIGEAIKRKQRPRSKGWAYSFRTATIRQ